MPLALRGVAGASVTIARLAMIDAALLARATPDVVLAPLLSPEHDILDLARLLHKHGYSGALRAYCQPVPNARLIRAEVQQIWAEVDFDILEVHPRPD